MSEREPLSVIVVTRDEAANIGRCLSSVLWSEERVVVDSGSRDRTAEIAREHGATVVERPWGGYVEQKNYALERARHPWVLSLDADEWLTEAGAVEVQRALRAPGADAYAFNRMSEFCGVPLRHAWSPDWHVRLFRREHGRFTGGLVHERVGLPAGSRIGRFRERLLHRPYPTLATYLRKLDRYTDLAAQAAHERGERFSAWRLTFSPPAAWAKVMLLERGWLDGVPGWLVALGSGYHAALKYGKLWELERRARSSRADHS